ncbi:MAG: tetratricopeptide repeat protein [Actinomycetota bacterium]|nr:tetratricopeptide repeat protein [Actinomycetota bacterium]
MRGAARKGGPYRDPVAHLGDEQEATKFARLAVDARRILAGEDRESSAHLGHALTNLGNRLSHRGSVKHAVEATTEAVQIFRRLAEEDPDAYSPDLALVVCNWSDDLFKAGREQEALAAIREAVTLYRTMAEVNPAFQIDLAKSLLNLGAQLAKQWQYQEARAVTNESVTILQSMPVVTSAPHRTLLAFALARLGLWQPA